MRNHGNNTLNCGAHAPQSHAVVSPTKVTVSRTCRVFVLRNNRVGGITRWAAFPRLPLPMCFNTFDNSQFKTINWTDQRAFEIENVKICYASSYAYLGWSIQIARIRDQVKIHVDSKRGHIRTFFRLSRKEERGSVQNETRLCRKVLWRGPSCTAVRAGLATGNW